MESESALSELLLRLRGDLGLGILVVEQHLNLVKRATDRFIILTKGAVVGSGPTDAIDAPENQTLMAL